MIKIDAEKCNLCGLCTRICHESCLYIEDETLKIDSRFCSTCTQCIAVCPSMAITWNGTEPARYNKSLYPKSEQLKELLQERRTVREYTSRKIDHELLEEIAQMAVYAPTHNFNLRAIIVDDEEIISLVDSIILNFSARVYKWLFKPKLILGLLRVFSPKSEFEYMKALPKLKKVIKRNSGFKTKPAAIIFIVGDTSIPLTLESAQYALYNIDLYAQTKRLACRNLVGNQMILNRNKDFKHTLGIKKTEKIVSCLTVGYPAVKFSNKVMGKTMNISWNRANEYALE